MSEGITSPISPYAWAAASRSMPAASAQLNIPQPNVPPVSSVIDRGDRLGALVAAGRPRGSSSARRSPGGDAAQAGNAAAAASAARRASSGPPAATGLAPTPSTGPELSHERPELGGHPFAADQQPLLLELYRGHPLLLQ